MDAPNSSNTAAIFIAYHPDQNFPQRVDRVASQVDKIIVVDNASFGNTRCMLQALRSNPHTELIENATNEGIASALNRGICRAAQLGYEWVLTMDQDSAVDPDLISHLRQVYELCPFRDQLGIVGANFHLGSAGIDLLHTERTRRPWIENSTAITSGSLLNVAAFKKAGPFREDFFIDSVDHEYCLRLRSRDYRIISSRRRLMQHAIGQPQVYPFLFGKKVLSFNHSPLRRYYHTRNRLVLVANYFSLEPEFCLREILGIATETITIILYENQKMEKLRAIALGFRHALFHRMGRLLVEPWERRR